MNVRNRRLSVGGLLLLIALIALLLAYLRSTPPNEGQAIMLAKAHFQASNEFSYPKGYWSRADWNPKTQTWRVAFMPATRDGGYSLMTEVFPDKTCKSATFDFSVFDILH